MKRNERGITLIALVVTIVVLLILAGVSISMLTGENGIISRSTQAKEATEQAKLQEIVDLAIESLITKNNGNTSEITPANVAEEINNTENRTDVYAEGDAFPTNIIFQKEGKSAEAKLTSQTINVNLGNYIINNETYCDTLQEAVNLAKTNDIIKILKDVTETEEVTINKSITLDTNGKTMNLNNKLNINEDVKVVIRGNGKILGTLDETASMISFIRNDGILEIYETTISSNSPYSLCGTIGNHGELIVNSGKIENTKGGYSIYTETNAVINEGEIGIIKNQRASVTVNGGKIEEIVAQYATTSINGGSITNRVFLDLENNTLNIGNKNEEVNQNNPNIKQIDTVLAPNDSTTLNFYNGIIYREDYNGGIENVNIRPGYTTYYDSNLGGTILIPE